MSRILRVRPETLQENTKRLLGPNTRALYVVDKTVFALYRAEIERLGVENLLLLDASEEGKNLHTLMRIFDALSERNVSRSDFLVAIGGGITGDLCGFAAASYMRGMRYLNIPTTLLAMVDASIGGKTGCNYRNLKNLIGAFYEPEEIWIAPRFLSTLPIAELRTGIAEIIKIAMVLDEDFFCLLEALSPDSFAEQLPEIIERAQGLKESVVREDFEDRGARHSLNFGHTIGHALEALALDERKELRHGYAIAVGMAEMMRLALAQGYCDKEAHDRLIDLLKRHQLLSPLPYEMSRVFEKMQHDKKKAGDRFQFIISERVGSYRRLSLNREEAREFLGL